MSADRRVTALQDTAEIGHVFTVTDDGRVIDGPRGVYAPEVYHSDTDDIEVYGDGWEPLTGYTGQYGYRGAVMHPSEYLGGRLAEDILSTPGTYVVTVVDTPPDDDDSGPELVGWAVLRRAEQ